MPVYLDVIRNADFDAAEGLRFKLSPEQIQEVVDEYSRLTDWKNKDIAIHLLQDYEADALDDMMRDGLDSPTTETRAVAYCCLTKNFSAFNDFLRNGCVEKDLVDAAIKAKFGG